MTDLYRLVYTSRNLLQGTEAARATTVAEILATSQRNNTRVGVTGALLFNAGCFAQVLEGPRGAVEATFERIQRDARHSDVSVLQCEAVTERGFPNWSMAFVGHSPRGRALWQEIAGRTGFDLARIEGDKLFATLHAIVTEEEGTAPAKAEPETQRDVEAPAPRPAIAQPRSEAFDAERLRAELREQAPGRSPPAPHHDQPLGIQPQRDGRIPHSAMPRRMSTEGDLHAEVAVLRAALTVERGRTTDLRGKLDEANIALAVASDQADTLRRHRDIWAERARGLVTALCRDPDASDADPVLARAASHGDRDVGPVLAKIVG